MICTEFYNGQGLGNQLWLYAVTRSKALDLGVDFGIMHPERFKGLHFLNLDFGKQVFGGVGPEGGPPKTLPEQILHYYREPIERDPRTGQDITKEDPNFYDIKNFTKIDGNLQSLNFIKHQKSEIVKWFTPWQFEVGYEAPQLECIVNFRGGEYRTMKDVFLPKSYWQNAQEVMLHMEPKLTFKVVTDDPKLASKYFPKDEVKIQDMSFDYLNILKAKYLILSNSSFGWFPSWISGASKMTIAPKYWWGYNNAEYWSTGSIFTPEFNYLDRHGNLDLREAQSEV